jgi:indolepyruvate ferredoxin oxidoreductase alpha subunit
MKKSIAKVLLSGDEAVARGAYEAGCRVAASYPGTPATEILENVAGYEGIYCEWSTNEKVALEVCLGASMAGARALYASKHVGLNVAADPLFTAAYVGARGGLVIVTADDPGLHSSQNEQDNRYYGLAAKLPVLSPADSQEAKDFTRLAFEISEEFDIPVIIRLTTRISHSRTLVELGEKIERPSRGYEKNIQRNLVLPQFARLRHYSLEERISTLETFADRFPGNSIEWGKKTIGFIADGVAYQYAKEVEPKASFLKLGMSYPLPKKLVAKFCRQIKKVYVVEENDPFLEMAVRASGFEVTGKSRIPRVDELSPKRLRQALTGLKEETPKTAAIPNRPPLLCPGCGHRGIFYALAKFKPIITGDIGCYTLGALPPLNAMDTCVCMGASLTVAHGIEKAKGSDKKVVAVIGDSTFYHSGITGLIDIVYNKGNSLVVILDNLTTAMTGHQHHPGTGQTLGREPTQVVDLEAVSRGCGVENIWIADPYNLNATEETIRAALNTPGPGVIIARRLCVLLSKSSAPARVVNPDLCNGCELCLRLGCPAITLKDEKAVINSDLCFGDCGLCAQVCAHKAIS